jgi:hypothetical protein
MLLSSRPFICWTLLAVWSLATGSPASAQEIEGCARPNVSVFDESSDEWVCADPPDIECEDGAQLAFSDGWYCSEETREPARDDPDQPDLMCASGSPSFDEDSGQWACLEDACDVCRTEQHRCRQAARSAYDSCNADGRERASAICMGTERTHGVNHRGERIAIDWAKLECEFARVQDAETGELVETPVDCSGPGLDECIDGFADSRPSTSAAHQVQAQGGLEFGGEKSPVKGSVGGGWSGTWTKSWDGTQGYAVFCRDAFDAALSTCDCARECRK